MPTQKIEYLGFTLKSKRHDSHCNKKKKETTKTFSVG